MNVKLSLSFLISTLSLLLSTAVWGDDVKSDYQVAYDACVDAGGATLEKIKTTSSGASKVKDSDGNVCTEITFYQCKHKDRGDNFDENGVDKIKTLTKFKVCSQWQVYMSNEERRRNRRNSDDGNASGDANGGRDRNRNGDNDRSSSSSRTRRSSGGGSNGGIEIDFNGGWGEGSARTDGGFNFVVYCGEGVSEDECLRRAKSYLKIKYPNVDESKFDIEYGGIDKNASTGGSNRNGSNWGGSISLEGQGRDCSAGYELCGTHGCLTAQTCADIRARLEANADGRTSDGNCVSCMAGASYKPHWSQVVANVGMALSPIASMVGNMYAVSKQTAAYEAVNATWAATAQYGMEQCQTGIANYLQYTEDYQLPGVSTDEFNNFQCNGYGLGGYAGGGISGGYGGMYSNGYGGYSNPYLGAGYSSGMLSGMYGPYGQYSASAYGPYYSGSMSSGAGMGMYPYGYSSGYNPYGTAGGGVYLGGTLGNMANSLLNGYNSGSPLLSISGGLGTGAGTGYSYNPYTYGGYSGLGTYSPYSYGGTGSYWNGTGGWNNSGYAGGMGTGYGYGNDYAGAASAYNNRLQSNYYGSAGQYNSLYRNYNQAANNLYGYGSYSPYSTGSYNMGNQYGYNGGFGFTLSY